MRLFLYFLVKTENMRTQIWCAFFSICLSKLKICARMYDAPFSLFSCQDWKDAHTNMMCLFLFFRVRTENMRTQIWCAFFSICLSKLKICAHKYAHTNICMSPARRLIELWTPVRLYHRLYNYIIYIIYIGLSLIPPPDTAVYIITLHTDFKIN